MDVSKRLSVGLQKAWYEREEVLAGILKVFKLACIGLTLLYSWNKYNEAYIPLVADISGKQSDITRLSGETEAADKQLKKLIQPNRERAEFPLQRKYWADKLVNLAQWVPDNTYITNISLLEVKKLESGDPQKPPVVKKFLMLRGLTPILERGKYLAKMVSLTQNINGDQAFTKNFQPMQLNYTRYVKANESKPGMAEMVEFELEAEAKY